MVAPRSSGRRSTSEPFDGPADRAAGGGDDDGFGHVIPLDRRRWRDRGAAHAGEGRDSRRFGRRWEILGPGRRSRSTALVAPAGAQELERVLWLSRSSASTCGPPGSSRRRPSGSTPRPSRWGSGPTPAASTCSPCPSTTARPTATCRRRSCSAAPWPLAPSASPCGSRRCCFPLHDPIRLAEDIAVLDLISGGRVSLVTGLGYRPVEYAMFGKEWTRRGKLLDEALDVHDAGVDRRAVRVPGRDRAGDPAAGAAAPPGDHDRRRRCAGGQAGGPARVQHVPVDRRPRALPHATWPSASGWAPRRASSVARRGPARCSWPTTPTGCGATSAPTCCTTP